MSRNENTYESNNDIERLPQKAFSRVERKYAYNENYLGMTLLKTEKISMENDFGMIFSTELFVAVSHL